MQLHGRILELGFWRENFADPYYIIIVSRRQLNRTSDGGSLYGDSLTTGIFPDPAVVFGSNPRWDGDLLLIAARERMRFDGPQDQGFAAMRTPRTYLWQVTHFMVTSK